MPTDEDRARRYAAGLYSEAPMQDPQAVDGDPQYASLCMFLATHASIGAHGHVLDVGAGRGVLARAMLETDWPDGAPWYVAIDLGGPLDALQLPTVIHNHSKKIPFSDFLERGLGGDHNHAVLVVLRNLLHELDIVITAKLIAAINRHVSPRTAILIQDMEDLPDAESRNAPWAPTRLKEVLNALEMKPQCTSLVSRSGTRWFNVNAESNPNSIDYVHIGHVVAQARSSQGNDLAVEAGELLAQQDSSTARREIIIPRDRNTIDLQVRAWKAHQPLHGKQSGPLIPGTSIALIHDTAEAFFIRALSADGRPSEILGTLRSKDAIDMPETIKGAKWRLWFWGYSNKRICDKDNARSVAEAAQRGVDVRVMLVEPNSSAASARAAVSAYETPERLRLDIRETVEQAASWQDSGPWADVRLTDTPPPASVFIVDNYCVASYYTSLLTGTSSPSVVMRELDGDSSLTGILIREFRIAFDAARPARAWMLDEL